MKVDLQRGDRVGDFTVLRRVHSGAHTEIVHARDQNGNLAALKFAADGNEASLAGERSRLLELVGCPLPTVLGHGDFAGAEYLALEWRSGVDVRLAAGDARGDSLRAAVALASDIVRAFASIHQRGVIHGQIHPRHVLVDGDGLVSIVDMAQTAIDVGQLTDPAAARRWLNGDAAHIPTFADEQYSVAALVVLLVTGHAPFAATRSRTELARQVLQGSVPTISQIRGESLPSLDRILRRALHLDPDRRYPSLDSFADALDTSTSPTRTRDVALGPSGDLLASHLADFRAQATALDPATNPIATAPTCSVNYGAAGVAYALIHVARAQSEPELLEAATWWLDVAQHDQGRPDAFYADGLEPGMIGRISPFHTGSGLAVVGARLSHATGDVQGHRRWLATYRDRIRHPTRNPDSTLGRSSVVLGACQALIGADPTWPEVRQLEDDVSALLDQVWRDLGPLSSLEYLGVAHGWAGILYASLLWSDTASWALPEDFHSRLQDLASCAEGLGRGATWPVFSALDRPDTWWGWCNGQAGHVMLWALAYTVLGDERWRRLATSAAWSVVDAPVGVSSLCCGCAGEIYALLSAYRCTGDASWHARAVDKAHQASVDAVLASDAPTPLSLYKGDTGLAILACDLMKPDTSAMPLFEVETGRAP
ncbi:lanthionine synthetase LanC family protein [Allobranchiibius huperziae]|uniref:Serine/threonine-protein kinase n=1 Tax=Allobranchiibius huperziae TaxID=1874116 RepID=A0A853DFS6_9MICO|nr:lanthionine synthetase LanC family protein [Allobranchiibius huperziae]NYJ74883.1 serine/threonine-protein kinase [Allobranchiibius huperziae]